MFVYALWILYVICGFGINIGTAISEHNRCIIKESGTLAGVRNQFCTVKNNDVDIVCPRNKKIAILSLNVVVKQSTEECTKRVLTHEDTFCCNAEDDDAIYNAECLQNIWSLEDKEHYTEFIQYTLETCSDKRKCALSSRYFNNLQKEIPSSRKYASYFQIVHRCVLVPTTPVDMCSQQSLSGKELHLQGSAPKDKTCHCKVTSKSDSRVTVRAVDIRTDGLILRSVNRVSNISHDQLPLFGFKSMLTANKIDISLGKGTINGNTNVWLHVSGFNGEDVTVECGEPPNDIPRVKLPEEESDVEEKTNTPLVRAATGKKDPMLGGYWPIFYLGAGALVTLVLIVCVIGSVLICRRSLKGDTKDAHYGNTYNQPQGHMYLPAQYDTVFDGISPYDELTAQKTLEWHRAMRCDPRTATLRSVRQAPTLPRPNRQGNMTVEPTPHSNNLMTASTTSAVSDFDAFVEIRTNS